MRSWSGWRNWRGCVAGILVVWCVQCELSAQIGIRWGHFYAYSLVAALPTERDADDGVVRISLVHYNTVAEVARIVAVLAEVLEL